MGDGRSAARGGRAELAFGWGSHEVEYRKHPEDIDGREEVLKDDSGSGGGASVMAFSHEAHRAVLSDFLDAIEQNRDPAIPGEEALATQRIIDAILTKGE